MGEYKFRLTTQVSTQAAQQASIVSGCAVGWPNPLAVLLLQAGLCLIGCLQLVAFTSLLFQFPYLYGRHGLQPISTVLEGAQADAAQQQLKLAGTTTL